jgi:enamine deaminase RidA (YjgF/YER057c/UK114 family)
MPPARSCADRKTFKMTRQNISSGSYLEPVIGFSRLVKTGNQIFIGGTAPIGSDGKCHGAGDVEAQTRRCFEIAEPSLAQVGASLSDVVRTRLILTDISLWAKAAKVHGEIFGQIRPVTTVMAVTGFVDPDWLIEIEVDAVVGRVD